MEIGPQPVCFQEESGATCNVTSKCDLPGQYVMSQHPSKFSACSRARKLKPLGKVAYLSQTPSWMKNIKINIECTPLFGSKTVQQMKLVKVHYENMSTVHKKLKTQNEALSLTMEWRTTKFYDGEEKLDNTVKPLSQWEEYLKAMKPKLREELDRLEKIRVIKPIDRPTDWVSSLVVVRSPMTSWEYASTQNCSTNHWSVAIIHFKSTMTSY